MAAPQAVNFQFWYFQAVSLFGELIEEKGSWDEEGPLA
jgi:hypothetical protein